MFVVWLTQRSDTLEFGEVAGGYVCGKIKLTRAGGVDLKPRGAAALRFQRAACLRVTMCALMLALL